jgi:hypothetical protein
MPSTSSMLSVGCKVKVRVNAGTNVERLSFGMSCRM